MNDTKHVNLFPSRSGSPGPHPTPSPAPDRDPELDRIPVPDRDRDRDPVRDPVRDPIPVPSRDSPFTVNSHRLPHHRLLAYGVARDLLLAVRAASIRDAKLRDEALRSAKSAALNCAEGAGRVTRPDEARAFAIARAECVEAAAAVEIAALCGEARPEPAREVMRLADRLVALLTPLARR